MNDDSRYALKPYSVDGCYIICDRTIDNDLPVVEVTIWESEDEELATLWDRESYALASRVVDFLNSISEVE